MSRRRSLLVAVFGAVAALVLVFVVALPFALTHRQDLPLERVYGDAAVSLWTTRVVAFTQWVGPGRRVTQTGRLTLAQARELVPALDTGDVIDPMVHGRVHRTTSTEELPELNTTCAWAKR